MEKFELKKQINNNPPIKHILSSIISEYDIKAAYPSALYFIKGKTLYDELMYMPKDIRNIKIGNMVKNDKELSDKLNNKLLEWMNLFIKSNGIRINQFLESTKDSIMIYNKVPKYLIFENGIVNFVNKDGDFTSYHRIGNKYTILYDQGVIGEKRIRIKGVNDEYVKSSKFVNKHLMKILSALESSVIQGKTSAVKKLQIEVGNIIKLANKGKTEEELCIFRELSNKNQYRYINQTEDGQSSIIYTDYLINDNDVILDTSKNYVEFVIPILKTLF